MARIPLVCRVCGRDFVAPRFDAKTCSSTCRQRLRRGGDLAYLAGLGKRQQRAERKLHEAWDALKVAHRNDVAAERAERRKLREQKAEEKKQRFLDETIGRFHREQRAAGGKKRQRQVQLLFAKERRIRPGSATSA
jgi:hypothetical protein